MTSSLPRRLPRDMSLSRKGLALILRFEGFVPYPYDDQRSGRRYVPITSSLGTPTVRVEYPEWKGGPLSGAVTIGYGHTNLSGKPPRIVPGLTMTEPEAFALLRDVLAAVYEPAVRRQVKVPLTQGEYDALVSWTYNLGEGALARSTMLKRINARRYAEVPAEIVKWNRAGGKPSRGLDKRRAAEVDLWDDPVPGSPVDITPAPVASADRLPSVPSPPTAPVAVPAPARPSGWSRLFDLLFKRG